MDKRIPLLALLVSLVILSGCIKVNIREDIDAQGLSTLSMKMDMSAIPDTGAETGNPCDEMTQNMQQSGGLPLTGIQCTYEDKVLTLTGQIDRSSTPGFSMEDGKYRLDVMQAIQGLSTDPSSGQSLPEDSTQLQQLKATGFEYNYTVKLPGQVVEQQGGEIQDDGSVKFDILSLPENAFVESEIPAGLFGLDTTTLMIAGAVVAVIVVVAIIVLLKR